MSPDPNLCKPVEIKEETLEWRKAGMPGNLLVIGADCMGNKFCYDLTDLKKMDDARVPIYFWDHDFLETDEIAPSFLDWFNGYLGNWSEGVTYSDF